MKKVIEIENLSKGFGSLQVLKGINLPVNGGEVLSLLGPSGSGKTTLLRCITGLDKDYTGTISIEGTAQHDYLKSHRIAFVTQKYANYPWLTVEQNIRLGFKHSGASNEEIQQKTTSLIENLELTGFKNYFIDQLSGGMQQRVAIGRALAQDTDILAMDEPFGALDYQTRETLQLLIKKINAEYKKTIIFVTHDIEEALFISHRIVMISKPPSVITNEYQAKFFNQINNDIRFNPEFVEQRRDIESDIRKLSNNNIISIKRGHYHDFRESGQLAVSQHGK